MLNSPVFRRVSPVPQAWRPSDQPAGANLGRRWLMTALASLVCGLAVLTANPSAHQAARRDGPWGEIQLSPLYLEAPASLIEAAPRPNQTTVWFFAHMGEADLREKPDRGLIGPRGRFDQ